MRKIAVAPSLVSEKRFVYLEDYTPWDQEYPVALTLSTSSGDARVFLSLAGAADLVAELTKMIATIAIDNIPKKES